MTTPALSPRPDGGYGVIQVFHLGVGISRMLFSTPVFGADGPNKEVSRPKKPRGAWKILSFYNYNGLNGGKCEYLGKKTAQFGRIRPEYWRVNFGKLQSLASLEKKDHRYVHKYKTLFPIGLNKTNPFGLSILGWSLFFINFSDLTGSLSFQLRMNTKVLLRMK